MLNYHRKIIARCLELAENGLGFVAPNPMVGSVIVYDNKIIGEGYHRLIGKAHAEVNAIAAVVNQELLRESTLYVNLEPCSHFGKTPPCTDLIINKGIPKVVIAASDPNPLVAGRGIEKLRNAGIDVITSILEKEARFLNRRFYTFHEQKRPYIILKWAQTLDGFMDIDRQNNEPAQDNWITNDALKILVHKWRSEEAAILIGKNTANNDNPKLNIRYWAGQNPLRVILSREDDFSNNLHILDQSQPTRIYTRKSKPNSSNLEYISLKNDSIPFVINHLYSSGIQSVIIEGGKTILDRFLNLDLWDESRVLIGNKLFKQGLKSPKMLLNPTESYSIDNDTVLIYRK